MKSGLRRYPSYKYSQHEWLGSLPSHWDLRPNRSLFREVKTREVPGEQMLSVTIDRGVIRQADLLTDSTKKDSSNEDKSNYKLVEPGDIAYNKMRAWQGALGLSRYRGIVSPAYIVARLRGPGCPEYFHYLLRTPAFAKEAERWSYGISSDQWSLRWEDFKRIYCPVPPVDEQAAVARYLLHMDGQLNVLIGSYRRLVGVSKSVAERRESLLNEYRTRLISDVVVGAISVLEAAASLPREFEAVENEDGVPEEVNEIQSHAD